MGKGYEQEIHKTGGRNFMSCYVFSIMIMWSRKWQPTPIFLPGESHGQEPVGL